MVATFPVKSPSAVSMALSSGGARLDEDELKTNVKVNFTIGRMISV
jgi:hypothetical protein